MLPSGDGKIRLSVGRLLPAVRPTKKKGPRGKGGNNNPNPLTNVDP